MGGGALVAGHLADFVAWDHGSSDEETVQCFVPVFDAGLEVVVLKTALLEEVAMGESRVGLWLHGVNDLAHAGAIVDGD